MPVPMVRRFPAIQGLVPDVYKGVRSILPLPSLAVALALALAACGGSGDSSQPLREVPPAEANFILHAANMSFALPNVDVRVWIDDRLAVSASLLVDHGKPGQRPWQVHYFRVEPGEHFLRVETTRGEAVLERTIEIREKRWGTLMYWFYPQGSDRVARPTPRHFYFDLAAQPPAIP